MGFNSAFKGLIRINIKVDRLTTTSKPLCRLHYIEAKLRVLNLVDRKLSLFVTLKHVLPGYGTSTRKT